jgi:hypothetical protein
VSEDDVESLQALVLSSETDMVRLVQDDVAWTAAVDSWMRFFDPGIAIRVGSGMGDATLTYIGVDGFREALKDWFSPWDRYYVAELEMIDWGDRVLRPTSLLGRTDRRS